MNVIGAIVKNSDSHGVQYLANCINQKKGVHG